MEELTTNNKPPDAAKAMLAERNELDVRSEEVQEIIGGPRTGW